MEEKELQIVSFEQAQRLKALGFDWAISRNSYKDLYFAPTVALALKWMRDEKDIVCHAISEMKHFRLSYKFLYRINYAQVKSKKEFDTCEAAESALLDELIDIIENENK
jgi:hypothetical protein